MENTLEESIMYLVRRKTDSGYVDSTLNEYSTTEYNEGAWILGTVFEDVQDAVLAVKKEGLDELRWHNDDGVNTCEFSFVKKYRAELRVTEEQDNPDAGDLVTEWEIVKCVFVPKSLGR